MRHNNFSYFHFLIISLLLISCGTKKQATTSVGNIPTQETVTPAETVPQEEACVTAKLGLTLVTNDRSVALGGALRMKRNDVIQLSLITFGILEVARIEMTPDYFMIINKMERQYVKAAYSDVSFLKDAGIDFRTIQSYFWDEQTSSPKAWQRSDFVSLGGRTFPTKHIISIARGGKSVKATITLSNLRNDSDWQTHTPVPTHYTEVPVDKLLSRLIER